MTQPPPNPYAYPYAPPPPPARRWWQHPAVVITALVVFPPGGIALAWLSRWAQGPKIVATVLAGLWFLAPFLGDPPQDDAKPKAAGATAAPTATTTPSDSPTPSPTPSVSPAMPRVTARTFAEASATLAPLALASVEPASAYTDVTLPATTDDWTVCFQNPAPGELIDSPTTTTARLSLTAPATPCPTSENTRLHPAPKPKPTPTPTSEPEPTYDNDGTTGGSGGSGGSDDGVYYKNCTAAREAGAAPIRRGEPGYRSALDRDGDGIACDS